MYMYIYIYTYIQDKNSEDEFTVCAFIDKYFQQWSRPICVQI